MFCFLFPKMGKICQMCLLDFQSSQSMDAWPVPLFTTRGIETERKDNLTDRCSSRLASAWLYSSSSRSTGRAWDPDACRLSHWCSWQEFLLRRGGSSSVPEKRRRTTRWAASRDAPRLCAARERERDRERNGERETGDKQYTKCIFFNQVFVW